MEDILVERFVRYFADTDPAREVLRPGSCGLACGNIRAALRFLGIHTKSSDPSRYDGALQSAVQQFQTAYGHRSHDGLVGPGTRRLLTGIVLTRFGPEMFLRLQDPDRGLPPKVFVSYSTQDTSAVDKLDQWLRDHGVRVIRYTHAFQPGRDILSSARNAIAVSDKVLVIHSANSISTDWVQSEIALAEELERRLRTPLLIYLLLDDKPLPEHDPHRIAVMAAGKALREVGQELLHAIMGRERKLPSYGYNEDEPLT